MDEKYEKCGALKPSLHLLCMNDERKMSNKTIGGLEIDSEDIRGLQCRATAFIEVPSNLQQTFAGRRWSECFSSAGLGCDSRGVKT